MAIYISKFRLLIITYSTGCFYKWFKAHYFIDVIVYLLHKRSDYGHNEINLVTRVIVVVSGGWVVRGCIFVLALAVHVHFYCMWICEYCWCLVVEDGIVPVSCMVLSLGVGVGFHCRMVFETVHVRVYVYSRGVLFALELSRGMRNERVSLPSGLAVSIDFAMQSIALSGITETQWTN